MLRALVLPLVLSVAASAQTVSRPGALPVASPEAAGALLSHLRDKDPHVYGRAGLLFGAGVSSTSPELRRLAGPFVAALEVAGVPLDQLDTVPPQPTVLAALQQGENAIVQRYAELSTRGAAASLEDVKELTELGSTFGPLLADERSHKALQAAMHVAAALAGPAPAAPSTLAAAAAAPAAAPAVEPGLETAKTLAALLKDSDDSDDTASIVVRMRQAAARFKGPETARVLVDALADRLGEGYEDEDEPLLRGLEDAAWAGGDAARLAAAKALFKSADDSDDMDDGLSRLGRAMRLVGAADDVSKAAFAERLRKRGADEPSGDWERELLLRADRLDDELAWRTVAPADAPLMALVEQLRESRGDANEGVLKRIADAWPAASGPGLELLERGLSRELKARAERDEEWDEGVASALAELGKSAARSGIAERAAKGLRAAGSAAGFEDEAEDLAADVLGKPRPSRDDEDDAPAAEPPSPARAGASVEAAPLVIVAPTQSSPAASPFEESNRKASLVLRIAVAALAAVGVLAAVLYILAH